MVNAFFNSACHTAVVVFFSVKIVEPQNFFVTYFLILSFAVALNITVVSRQFGPWACAVLSITQQCDLSKPVSDSGFVDTAPRSQDPLPELRKSCSSHAASFDELFLAASHPSLPLNSKFSYT